MRPSCLRTFLPSLPALSAQSCLLIYFPHQHLAFWDSASLLAWGPSHHELNTCHTCRAWGVASALPRPLLGVKEGSMGHVGHPLMYVSS